MEQERPLDIEGLTERIKALLDRIARGWTDREPHDDQFVNSESALICLRDRVE